MGDLVKSNSFTSTVHAYYVVEFVSRGRKPATKKIDVVVGAWLQYNKALKKVVTKYPDPPYDMLQYYLENSLPAEDDWSTYTVRLRGRAGNLEIKYFLFN